MLGDSVTQFSTVIGTYLFAMGMPLFLAYLLLAVRSRVHPNWIAAAVVPMFCHMAIYWDRRWREGVRGVKPWLVLVIGPIYFVIYFLVFYGLIRALNMKTPGREDVQAEGSSGMEAANDTVDGQHH